jgi:hypothetical protein
MNGLDWFKSSYSSANGACVECAPLPGGGMAVRDTQNRDDGTLSFNAEAWTTFLGTLQ